MITPVSSSNLIDKFLASSNAGLSANKKNNVRTSIFYINDYHGKSINMERTVTASRAYDSFVKQHKDNGNIDVLKLSSGDIMLGEVEKVNDVAMEFQNIIGITASAMGNHEYDMPDKIGNLIPKMKYKLLAANVKIKPDNPFSKKVEKSYIEEHNGHKYGIIATTPTDLFSRLKYGHIFTELDVDNIDDTIKDVQAEADKLKKQGVDKIILLSHSGYGYDKKIAQNTDGIDIILGGHSHNLVQDVKSGENLLSSKSGEPVVITQAGRDGKHFGVLNVEFDENGRIVKAQNNITPTRGFKRNVPVRYVFDKLFGKPQVIGYVRTSPPPLTEDLIQPSGHAQFLVDCIKRDLGTDIALLSAANVRGYIEPGNLDTRYLEDISPFHNNLCIIPYTEKEIVEALKQTCKSFVNPNNKPGILHPSGLRYTVSRSTGELKELYFIDKNGKENKIDINNPREDKIYRTAINDYYAQGNDDMTVLKKIDEAEKVFDFDLNKCVIDYMKTSGPVDIYDDGRVKVVD